MPSKIEKLTEGAYFIFEPMMFNTCITPYDAVIANQTIVPDWSSVQLESVRLVTPGYPMPAPSNQPPLPELP
jgi:hypothetical protein